MNFAREGYPLMALGASIAIAVLALAVWRRSWPLWLVGFLLLVIAACVAWVFRLPPSRDTERLRPRAVAAATATPGRLV